MDFDYGSEGADLALKLSEVCNQKLNLGGGACTMNARNESLNALQCLEMKVHRSHLRLSAQRQVILTGHCGPCRVNNHALEVADCMDHEVLS